MATIDDFGDTAEPLNNPVLGGPAGWAAAVRDAINGKVSKAGDMVSGILSVAGLNILGGGDLTWESGPAQIQTTTGALEVWTGGALGNVAVASPSQANHAATRDYVDNRVIAATAHLAGTTDVNGWIDWTVPLPQGWGNVVGFAVSPDTDTFYSQGAFMMSTGLVGNSGTVLTFRSICAATPIFSGKTLRVDYVIVLAR